MHLNKLFSAFFVLFLFGCINQASAEKWDGEYTFDTELGKTVGGSSILMVYTIFIGSGEKQTCKIAVDGFQTMQRLTCNMESSGESATLSFKGFENGSLLNDYGIEVYNENEALLVFSYEQNSDTLFTEWKSLNPFQIQPKKGIYFSKK